jgi:cytochrome P450
MWAIQGVGALLVAFVIASVLFRATRTKPDPREPPVLQPRIPFIGHIIGLLQHGSDYYSMASARCKHPIFSMPMLNSRIYLTTSPNLASHVQRASTTLQFKPLIIEVTSHMVGLSDDAKAILFDRAAKKEGRPEFMDYMHDSMYTTLSPSEIKTASKIVLQKLTKHVNAMPVQLQTGLYDWVRGQFTQLTTSAFFGPENPFVQDPSLIDDFWTWEADMIKCSMAPKSLARKAFKARERVVKGLIEYLQKERVKKADRLVQERFRLHSEYGLSIEAAARADFGLLFGALANGTQTTFWLLNNVFSRPALLEELRHEIREHAMTETNHAGRKTITISFEALKSSCPLLNSCYRETIRLTAPVTSARQVTADTLIAGEYLLRANSVVQIAGGVIHSDTSIWGPDASSFNPRRFLTSPYGTKTGTPSSSESTNVHPAAFRGFGGGTVYCPGRHFAQVEILSLTAVLVMGFDFLAPKGTGTIEYDPPQDLKRIPIGVMKPLREVELCMRRREGLENVEWVVALV